ncbi:MAG: SGNH/GDSL hydrolase family protein, partial [Coleofasciculus sp. S288]|nr:SGNH/GDSL hydrolase family protein [Coleofasciculus sp. S288]
MKLRLKNGILSFIGITFIATELTLRLGFGLGNPALLQADSDTGYRYQPNQKISRFSNKIEYNQYSQRSDPITPQKPKGTLRILMTGDSVLNGGNAIDQKQIISELLEAKFLASGRLTEVLNASAGSWGIGNQLGYLRKFGIFESDVVIVQIGTHDLIQTTSTSEPVGHHPAFPNRPPLLAIQEVFTRYIGLRLYWMFGSNLPSAQTPAPSATEIEQQFQKNMQDLRAIATLVRAKNAQLFVLFTPNKEDLLPTPHTPLYKAEFFQLLNSLQIPVIDSHKAWLTLSPTLIKSYFRDSPH